MRAPTFVDTNVLLYARDSSQGDKHGRALEWLTLLWREQTGRTSIQVLNEYYVNLTRKLQPAVPHDEAWADVDALLAWSPRVIDAPLIASARELERRYRTSWWDSLIVAAAQAEGCAVLLTEDLQDGAQFGTVTVRNPFRSTIAETPPVYKPLAAPVSRHRPRGRPKKLTGTVS